MCLVLCSGVAGSVASVPLTFPQTGAVSLYNLSNLHQPPLAVFRGDRRYSRFGSQIMVNEALTHWPLVMSLVPAVLSDFW